MSGNFCDCGRALKTTDEYRRGCCNRCREAAAVSALEDPTDDTEEDELADLTLPLCLYCGVRLTNEDNDFCSDECRHLFRLYPESYCRVPVRPRVRAALEL